MDTAPDTMRSLPESIEALHALVLATFAERDAAVLDRDTLLAQNDRLQCAARAFCAAPDE